MFQGIDKKNLMLIYTGFGLAVMPMPTVYADEAPNQVFENSLKTLCGKSFQGTVVEGNESDEAWRQARIIMGKVSCYDGIYKIPLAVGENTSRTWIITRKGDYLCLKHDHRHEDGTPDEVTMYGGTTKGPGMPTHQYFPADQYSKDMFLENGLNASVDNTWVLIIEPGQTFSYRLQRPGRTFQIDFDLTKPVE